MPNFFQKQLVDEAGRLAIDFEKILILLWLFRLYFLIVAIISAMSLACYFPLRILLDLYVFLFGSLSLAIGFYGALKRKDFFVGLYIGSTILWIFSSLLILVGSIHVYQNPFMFMYCLPSVEHLDSNLASFFAISDLILYFLNFIVLCVSVKWAVVLAVEIRKASSDSVCSAAYGQLGSDDFSSLQSNHEYSPSAPESLFEDSDDDGFAVSSDEEVPLGL